MCPPAGLEEFLLAIGETVDRRTTWAPKLSREEQEQFLKKARAMSRNTGRNYSCREAEARRNRGAAPPKQFTAAAVKRDSTAV